MKAVLIFVSSLDGKVTKWDDPNVKIWTSHQDQEYYRQIWNECRLIVMGSNTYNVDPHPASPNHLKVVMTSHPEKYKSNYAPGQLEFTSESPKELFSRFEKEGRKDVLVIGGPHVATSFLKDALIDELWLTIEPKIFGAGSNFAIEEKLDISLELLSFEKVNKQGTLITKYAVVKQKGVR